MSGKIFTSKLVRALMCLMSSTLIACGGSGGSDSKIDNNVSVNNQPEISALTEHQISEFQYFELILQVSDADDDSLSVEVTGLPSWLTFDANNLQIYGKATAQSAGVYSDITFTVSDGELSDSVTIALTVVDAVQLSGKVIDGYISGAIVYVDLNNNGQYDENSEPNALSNAQGGFSLIVDEFNINKVQTSFIRAYIGNGADDISRNTDDFSSKPLTLTYSPLMALSVATPVVENINITPFTHLIAEQLRVLIDEQQAISEAQIIQLKQQATDNIASRLALSQQQLNSDYFSSSTNLSDEKRQWMKSFSTWQFEQLHELQNKALDSDNNGVANALDADVDGDQVANIYDHFPLDNRESVDTDLDGIGNNRDTDDDNDSVIDSEDDFPLDSRYSKATDLDNDGWPQGQDVDDENSSLPIEEFVDTDGDGYADNGGLAPDNDDDNDSVIDSEDAFPLEPNESKDTDFDGIGNNQDKDDDGDLVADYDDAFPLDANESKDSDGDGIGNNADPDDDNDGIIDELDETPVGEPPANEIASSLRFIDSTEQSELQKYWGVSDLANYQQEHDLIVQHVHGGIASGDFDLDGDIDLFIIGGDKTRAQLYKNLGNGLYEDIAEIAGVNISGKYSGPSFADTDGDGDLDLFVGGIGGNKSKLFVNQGNGTFTEKLAAVPIQAKHTISSTFADYDRDGDLDLVISHYGTSNEQLSDHLWLNSGNNEFIPYNVNASLKDTNIAGYRNNIEMSFSPSFADFDNDQYADLFMVSDYLQSSYFSNAKNGTFIERTPDLGFNIDDLQGMGSAIADFDNDGDLDAFVTSIFSYLIDSGSLLYSGNKFLQNNGSGEFNDISYISGTFDSGWAWGTCAADFNNDGLMDIFVTNGYFINFPDSKGHELNSEDTVKLFINQGNNKFVAVKAESGLTDQGQGRAVSCLDDDNDGDIDIVLTNHNVVGNSIKRYQNNNGNSLGNYLQITLKSSSSNSHAIGARVYLKTITNEQMREVNINSNFTSHNPSQLHFGLGKQTEIETIKIVWPNGEIQYLQDIAVNQSLLVEQVLSN
ncbi:FG-GAP-like repeat-containing protein [Thalassotalea crassostreae]|uniref:FG-GAP-like repeat-containing protein n=1 Tax=Thalassotalea crassostreae TaxID=1763536 RepID=UPI000837DDF7|nr:FG-GAP-like repeat-containing protein [Thalassotalea crassostreae]